MSTQLHHPNWDIDKEFGFEGEARVRNFRESFVGNRVEVKTERLAATTGNVFVESYQKPRHSSKKPSGILTTEAAWWTFNIGEASISIPVDELRKLYDHYASMGLVKGGVQGDNPTEGALVPIRALLGIKEGVLK